jgi:hypothetical protein
LLANDAGVVELSCVEERAVRNFHARPRVPVTRLIAEQSDAEEKAVHIESPAYGCNSLLADQCEDRIKLALQVARPP